MIESYTTPSGLFKILSGEELLKTKLRQNLQNKIQAMVSLPDRHYQELIKRLIENYALFVQQLPATQNEHHATPGGLLDFSLNVTSIALLIRRGFMLPVGALPEVVAKKHELWTYAVLTAGLLKHLGPTLNQYTVRLYDAKENFVKTWEPLRESMMNQAYYDVRFTDKPFIGLGARMNLLFVRSLMPRDGMVWLSGDSDIMSAWLATLSGDMASGGIIGQIVERATHQSLQKKPSGEESKVATHEKGALKPTQKMELSDLKKPIAEAPVLENIPELPSTEKEIAEQIATAGTEVSAYGLIANIDEYPTELGGEHPMHSRLEPSSDLGDFFMQWLRTSLAEKKILFNQDEGGIHMVAEGIFLVCPQIFQKFVDLHPELEIQAASVQNRFQKLKLHKKHEGGLNLFNYASYHTGKRTVYRGYVIEKVSEVLPSEFPLPKPNPNLELDFV